MQARWVLGYLVLIAAAASGTALADNGKAAAKGGAAAKAGDVKAGAAKAGDGKAPGDTRHHDNGNEPDENEPAAEPAADPLQGLAHITGPQKVELGHGAQIDVPAGMVLFEKAVALDLLRKGGNPADNVVALVIPVPGTGSWELWIQAEDVGYVSDSDAGDLDAAAFLEGFKTGTIAQNKERVAKGIPELFVDGWSEPLRYDAKQHRLVWGLNAHGKDGKSVNFFNRMLGRSGFLSIDLIDSAESIEASKGQAVAVINAIQFKPGSRYEDHASDDKSSGMGLTALVVAGTGIVIAKKTGILIAIVLFMKKGVILVVAAIAAFFKRMFGRGKKQPAVVGAPMPPPGGNAPVGYVPPEDFGSPHGGPGGAGGAGGAGAGGFDPHAGAGYPPPGGTGGGWPPGGSGGTGGPPSGQG